MRYFKDLLRRAVLRSAELGRRSPFFATVLVGIYKFFDLFTGRKKGRSISEAVERFASRLDIKVDKNLKEDIWKAAAINLIVPNEYFFMRFDRRNAEERYDFVGDRERSLLCGMLSDEKSGKIFSDKWQAYQRFQRYYKREAIRYDGDEESFRNFFEKHRRIIIKPEQASRGKGIFIADLDKGDTVEAVLDKMKREAGNWRSYMVEEVITESAELRQFNESVNTVRIATFRNAEGTRILFNHFRCGRKGSVTDNTGSGGMSAAIDSRTGICMTSFMDKNCCRYTEHPDSHVKVIGFRMPEWDKLLELTYELAEVVSEQKYVGWDLAHTDKGWIMIEGNNRAQYGTQIPGQFGLRKEIKETFYKELNL
ncbi:MAG: hypothetical protein IKF68_05480 [Erysipelotrichaceae bacterium]|nr:hypothetical protein [Erysipelotrichaceae bacterium]